MQYDPCIVHFRYIWRINNYIGILNIHSFITKKCSFEDERCAKNSLKHAYIMAS
jgi:hypothetical protein